MARCGTRWNPPNAVLRVTRAERAAYGAGEALRLPDIGEPANEVVIGLEEQRLDALVRMEDPTARQKRSSATGAIRPRAGFGDGRPVGITPHATGSLKNRWSTGCHLGALKATEGCLSLRTRHEPPACP